MGTFTRTTVVDAASATGSASYSPAGPDATLAIEISANSSITISGVLGNVSKLLGPAITADDIVELPTGNYDSFAIAYTVTTGTVSVWAGG
jgi:hypothetical protein